MEKIIEFIANMIKVFLDGLKIDKSPYLTKEPVKTKKKSGTKKISDRILSKSEEYEYENDTLVKDTIFDSRKYDKFLAVIHYTGHNDFKVTSKYLTKQTDANTTFLIGKKGETERHLPDPRHPSYCQGLEPQDKGGFIDYKGKWIRGVNYFACSFEVCNVRGQKFTTKQYEAVAVRIMWMLRTFPNFRPWYIISHEASDPKNRNDPGPDWDWEMFFCKLLGVKKSKYNKYLSYLHEISLSDSTGKKEATNRKLFAVKEATELIKADLLDKPKDYFF